MLHFLLTFHKKILTIGALFDGRIRSVQGAASTIIGRKCLVNFRCKIAHDGFGYIFSRFIDNVEAAKVFLFFFFERVSEVLVTVKLGHGTGRDLRVYSVFLIHFFSQQIAVFVAAFVKS